MADAEAINRRHPENQVDQSTVSVHAAWNGVAAALADRLQRAVSPYTEVDRLQDPRVQQSLEDRLVEINAMSFDVNDPIDKIQSAKEERQALILTLGFIQVNAALEVASSAFNQLVRESDLSQVFLTLEQEQQIEALPSPKQPQALLGRWQGYKNIIVATLDSYQDEVLANQTELAELEPQFVQLDADIDSISDRLREASPEELEALPSMVQRANQLQQRIQQLQALPLTPLDPQAYQEFVTTVVELDNRIGQSVANVPGLLFEAEAAEPARGESVLTRILGLGRGRQAEEAVVESDAAEPASLADLLVAGRQGRKDLVILEPTTGVVVRGETKPHELPRGDGVEALSPEAEAYRSFLLQLADESSELAELDIWTEERRQRLAEIVDDLVVNHRDVTANILGQAEHTLYSASGILTNYLGLESLKSLMGKIRETLVKTGLIELVSQDPDTIARDEFAYKLLPWFLVRRALHKTSHGHISETERENIFSALELFGEKVLEADSTGRTQLFEMARDTEPYQLAELIMAEADYAEALGDEANVELLAHLIAEYEVGRVIDALDFLLLISRGHPELTDAATRVANQFDFDTRVHWLTHILPVGGEAQLADQARSTLGIDNQRWRLLLENEVVLAARPEGRETWISRQEFHNAVISVLVRDNIMDTLKVKRLPPGYPYLEELRRYIPVRDISPQDWGEYRDVVTQYLNPESLQQAEKLLREISRITSTPPVRIADILFDRIVLDIPEERVRAVVYPDIARAAALFELLAPAIEAKRAEEAAQLLETQSALAEITKLKHTMETLAQLSKFNSRGELMYPNLKNYYEKSVGFSARSSGGQQDWGKFGDDLRDRITAIDTTLETVFVELFGEEQARQATLGDLVDHIEFQRLKNGKQRGNRMFVKAMQQLAAHPELKGFTYSDISSKVIRTILLGHDFPRPRTAQQILAYQPTNG